MQPDLFRVSGPLRAAYDAVDWASTSLGPVESWGPELRWSVDFTLSTRFPTTLLWGPEFVLVYNDAYVELIADKHPAALGQPAEKIFPEAWPVIGPMMASVLAGEGATWVRDAYLPLDRAGFVEECYFTFSYSPVHGPDGSVVGIVDVSVETTTEVIVSRRAHLLAGLAEALAGVGDLDTLRWTTLSVLAQDLADVPEADVVLWESGGVPQPPATADVSPDEEGRVSIPLRATRPTAPGGRLDARVSPMLRFDEGYREFLFMVATAVARAIDRIDVARAERSLSTALQRSLLTDPVDPDGASIAVRYLPASDVAQVGGDWYDAFVTPDGGFTVVVGDVAGHDQESAAAMGQLRNLVRGIAYSSGDLPAAVLGGLDEALAGLRVEVTATALVARCRPLPGRGLVVTWSSAGHLPPVVVDARGGARVLEDGDLLLGLEPALPRIDRTTTLAPGEHLLLYTDGLVERRGVHIDASVAAFVEAVAGHHDLTAQQLCDHVIAGLDDALDDDVALVVVRADPAA